MTATMTSTDLAGKFGQAADQAHAARSLALHPSPECDAELAAYSAMMRTAWLMLSEYGHTAASVTEHVRIWRDTAAQQVRELRSGEGRPDLVAYRAQHGRMDACEEILSDLEAALNV